MTLAPYHVPWALSACALALLALGLAWMVFHGGTLRVMAVLRLSDGVALWLAFAGAYHAVRLIPDDYGAAGQDAPAVVVVWGVLAVYALLRLTRLLPTRLRGEATLLATQTCLGAARMMIESPDSPSVLARKVMSPGGTTEAAFESMRANGVKQHLVDAVLSAWKRSQELGH